MSVILTGDRPTGKLHLGHYVGSLQNRVHFQDIYKQFIMIADVQALTDNFDDTAKISKNIMEVVKDYLSVGIDAEKSTIFLQSRITEIAELTIYYLNLVTVARLQRNPTVKNEIKQKGYLNSIPAGFLCYPVNQAADITIFHAEYVPVGEDQLPMIEQANEIVRKFNALYNCNFLKESKAILSSTPRLTGVDGKAKASKSLGNAIFLSDSKEDVKQKVMSMYTDPDHIKISDPGKVEGNVVFAYLDAFYGDKDELESLKSHYMKGGLGDVTIKNILIDTLQSFLDPIRQKRGLLKDEDVKNILQDGTFKAKSIASDTISQVRDIIGIGAIK